MLSAVASHQALCALYEHKPDNDGPVRVLGIFLLPLCSFSQARSHGAPGCQLLEVYHAGTSWAAHAGSRYFLTEGRQSPSTGLAASKTGACPVSRVLFLPNWQRTLPVFAHLPSPCPENRKMVYCSHQSAFLHSSCSFGGGIAARAKHLGLWLQTLASIIQWITSYQPPALPTSILLPTLSL